MGATNKQKTKFGFQQRAENPAAYTKLSCFLPWIAAQFGLTFDGGPEADETCLVGSGEKPASESIQQDDAQFLPNKEDVPCKEAIGLVPGVQFPCIFPFRYGDVTYDSCITMETSDFIVPVWRCPVFNSTKKYTDDNGVEMNWFPEEGADTAKGYCLDFDHILNQIKSNPNILSNPSDIFNVEIRVNPEKESCLSEVLSYEYVDEETKERLEPMYRIRPFSTCRNECPGGKGNVPKYSLASRQFHPSTH